MKTNIKKLPKSVVEIEGELEADIFESYYDKAFKKLGENLEIDGFRKGKVPENILKSKIPEIKILEEMAELALSEHYPKIIEEEKLDVISRPIITITKLARNNPFEFKIQTVLLPETKLPDYKKLAQEIISSLTDEEKNTEVSEEELEDTVLDIRKSRAPKINISEQAEKDAHVHGENCQHDHKNENKEKEAKIEPELPEFNDDFVKALGPFKDIEDFKTKLKENIKLEKENQIKERTRLKIMEKIIEKTEIDMPELLVNLEIDKIIYRMESDISAMGLKFEDYLKHINKTKEDLQKEFLPEAEKKAKLGLVLNEISKVEKIIADPERVANEVAMILEHYKEADPERAKLHAENVLTNEAVFRFLENQ
jgi:trigger factor